MQTKGLDKATWIGVASGLFFIVFLFAQGRQAVAGDKYWVVGGNAGQFFFTPDSKDGFPNNHPATLVARKADGSEYKSNSPIVISPTSATAGDKRLPVENKGYINVTPTGNQDNAGEAWIRIKFKKDNLDKETATRFVTVYKWVVVGCKLPDVVREDGFNGPSSIRPGKARSVTATITPSLKGTGHSVSFDINDQGEQKNGSATVTQYATTEECGPVEIQGGKMNETGHVGLKVRAKLDGKELCGESSVCAVCAHITDVTVTFVGNYGDEGIKTNVSWKSDSGGDVNPDLMDCFIRESVSYDTPIPKPVLWVPPENPMIPKKEGDSGAFGSRPDAHGYVPGLPAGIDNPRVTAEWNGKQHFQQKCKLCGLDWEPCSATYTITRSVNVLKMPTYTIAIPDVAGATRTVYIPPVITDVKCTPAEIPADGTSTSQASATVAPQGRTLNWSIVGNDLGCKIDSATGKVTAGTTAGAMSVRATDSVYQQHTADGTLNLKQP